MIVWLDSFPSWGRSLIWTALTIGGAWCIGHLLNVIVIARLGRLAATRQQWGEVVGLRLPRRVPLWSALVGVYASLAHWQLSPEAALLLTRGLFVVGAVSAMLFAAAVASRLIAAYGATVSLVLPVTSLTQSLTWVLVVALGALVGPTAWACPSRRCSPPWALAAWRLRWRCRNRWRTCLRGSSSRWPGRCGWVTT